MAYERKTVDEFRIEGNFGQGWEVVTYEETRKDGLLMLRDYRENDPEHPYRLRTVRVPKVKAVTPEERTAADTAVRHFDDARLALEQAEMYARRAGLPATAQDAYDLKRYVHARRRELVLLLAQVQ